jgi:hypothetical protein
MEAPRISARNPIKSMGLLPTATETLDKPLFVVGKGVVT